MGGVVGSVLGAFGTGAASAAGGMAAKSLFGTSSGGTSSGGSGSSGSQAAPQALCGQASVLSDSHSGSSSVDGPEQVVQGGLGSSFGILPQQGVSTGGALPTTYASGGTAKKYDDNVFGQFQKDIDDATPQFIDDTPTLLHYQHAAPVGALPSVHQGGFGNGYDGGGKVSDTPPPKAVKYVEHSSLFNDIGHALLPSVFKAGDDMKSSLNAPSEQAAKQTSANTCSSQKTAQTGSNQASADDSEPKEFHFDQGGLSHAYKEAAPEGHNPEFITGKTGYYASGAGTGQSDDIPAMLHDGDYVMDSDVVSALGDGSSKAGREVLDGFRERIPHKADGGEVKPVPAKIADGEYVFPASFVTALGSGDNKKGSEILDGLRTKLRQHKRGAPDSKIPPKAKDPMAYIEEKDKK